MNHQQHEAVLQPRTKTTHRDEQFHPSTRNTCTHQEESSSSVASPPSTTRFKCLDDVLEALLNCLKREQTLRRKVLQQGGKFSQLFHNDDDDDLDLMAQLVSETLLQQHTRNETNFRFQMMMKT